jgi:hypothetical protein
MAAPERFADKSDSSCTAGAVHTWPFSTFAATQHFGSDRRKSGRGWRALETALMTQLRHRPASHFAVAKQVSAAIEALGYSGMILRPDAKGRAL